MPTVKVAFDGLELTFTGTPAVNDSFTLKTSK
ncbi:hypothetical protein ACP0HM_02465 [Escherichia coli]